MVALSTFYFRLWKKKKKSGVFVSWKMLQHASQGGKGKNEKNVSARSMGNSSIVCNYSHCSKTASVVPAKERRRVISLSHYRRGGDTQEVLRRGGENKTALSRGSIHVNLDWWGKEKNHNSITVLLKKKKSKAALLNWTVLAFIQR